MLFNILSRFICSIFCSGLKYKIRFIKTCMVRIYVLKWISTVNSWYSITINTLGCRETAGKGSTFSKLDCWIGKLNHRLWNIESSWLGVKMIFKLDIWTFVLFCTSNSIMNQNILYAYHMIWYWIWIHNTESFRFCWQSYTS